MTATGGTNPMPLKAIMAADVAGSLEMITMFALSVPAEAGENVAVMVQLPDGAIVAGSAPQVPAPTVKLAPVVTELIVRSAAPLLVMVNACGVDDSPIAMLPKSRAVGVTLITGAMTMIFSPLGMALAKTVAR